MAKQSQIDRAIAALEAEITVLQHAIAKLKQQQQPAKKRPAKPAKDPE